MACVTTAFMCDNLPFTTLKRCLVLEDISKVLFIPFVHVRQNISVNNERIPTAKCAGNYSASIRMPEYTETSSNFYSTFSSSICSMGDLRHLSMFMSPNVVALPSNYCVSNLLVA